MNVVIRAATHEAAAWIRLAMHRPYAGHLAQPVDDGGFLLPDLQAPRMWCAPRANDRAFAVDESGNVGGIGFSQREGPYGAAPTRGYAGARTEALAARRDGATCLERATTNLAALEFTSSSREEWPTPSSESRTAV